MRLAHMTCPKCRTSYDGIQASPEVYYAPCPDCGQFNILPLGAPAITGLCGNCKLPLDDHIWSGDMAVHCP